MAQYKYDSFLSKGSSTAYDTFYTPGQTVPDSGIYKCKGCGKEIAANKNDPFPPQNHHQHPLLSPPIQWQLIVFAQG